jgi:sulfate-transporting ATPase
MAGVSKTYPPQKQVLKNIYLSFYYGAKIGVLGLNGSGKSSLLRIIAGEDKDYQGEIAFKGNYKIGHLSQEPKLDPTKTVMEVVKEGVQPLVDKLQEFDDVCMKLGEPMDDDQMNKLLDRQSRLQDELDASNAWELDNKLEVAMDALRCPESDQLCANLSGGEKRRVALCRLLLSEPDILLLDEPTNHLDAESVAWLESFLQNFPGTVIAVTHDRYFLDNVAGWILELDRGEGIPWEGNYSSWLEQKSNRLAQEEKQESKRQKALIRELDWVRQGAKGRQAKSKARLGAYDKMLNEETKDKEDKLELFIPAGPRLGDVVIDAKEVSKAYADKILFENFNFTLPKAGIVGVIGPNGAGKTTLFKMIMGKEKADSGSFTVGETVKISYVDQSHDSLNPEETIFEAISGGTENMIVGGKQLVSRAYIGKFNFGGQDQQKKVGVLSGGERNRLHLAMTLKDGGNVLLLDEPTNDIDVNTLRALEEAIENFAGCAVIISHDRWFLDRVATHIIAFEGDSQVVFFEGDYSAYEESLKKRKGYSGPHRVRYKNIGGGVMNA